MLPSSPRCSQQLRVVSPPCHVAAQSARPSRAGDGHKTTRLMATPRFRLHGGASISDTAGRVLRVYHRLRLRSLGSNCTVIHGLLAVSSPFMAAGRQQYNATRAALHHELSAVSLALPKGPQYQVLPIHDVKAALPGPRRSLCSPGAFT